MPYALHEAAEHGQLGELVKLFVLGDADQPVDVHARNAAGETALHAAVRSGRIDIVMFLLCNGAEVNAATEAGTGGQSGWTPLHIACSTGKGPIARHLLVSGANPNARTGASAAGPGGDTPLHLAVAAGNLELTRMLLNNGADPDAVNGLGRTPWQVAVAKGYRLLAHELAAHGAEAGQMPAFDQVPAGPAAEPEPEPPAAPVAPAKASEAPPAPTPPAAAALPEPPRAEVAATIENPKSPAPVAPEPSPPPSEPPRKPEATAARPIPPQLPVKAADQEPAPGKKPPLIEPDRKPEPKAPTKPAAESKLKLRVRPRRLDPTLDWGAFHKPIPDFDVARMQFGSLRFDDGLHSASFLGRPDRFEVTEEDYCELLYARGGFQLDFDKDRFVYLAFFIGPDACLPDHPDLQFASPRIRGSSLSGIHLTRQTDRSALERIFGAPNSVDADGQEAILYYQRQRIAMEFELDGRTGRLKRWNLYPHKLERSRPTPPPLPRE